MKSQVIIQIAIEGFHNYPDAPEVVSFLSNKHRHTFIIKAGFKVDDLNREKEIFIQRDLLKNYLYESFGNPCDFDDMSCEMIAKEIILFFEYENILWCEVWEEKTGGARIDL